MAINSVIQNYIGSLIAEEALAPSAPGIRTPDPFSEEERADIGFQKFGTRIVDRDIDLGTTASTRRESDGDTTGYSGPLDVSRIYREQGAVLPEQGFFDKKFGSKPTIDKITGKISYGMPRGMSPFLGFSGIFAQLGSAASRRNLERIYEKIQAGEEGYGLAMLNGRVVGVGPGPMEGSTVLSGVLPEGLTSQQRYQLGQSILAAGAPTDEPPPPQLSFEERKAQYEASGESPDGSSSLLSGGNINIVQDDAGRPVTSGGKPVTTSAGQYVDPALLAAQADAMKAAAQQDKAPVEASPFEVQRDEPASSPSRPEPSGYGRDSSGSQRSDPSGYGGFGGRRATGGTVGFAEEGTTQKDPIQRTGFVEGPPQEYAKGTTVADTENLRVKEGSFVINAPMTEKLQEAGVLPKGNQKRKAAKGGNMMEVALSKGEYVVEPKDVPKFGGYNFLEAVNDMGKPEVERRQAMQNGGFVTPPERSPFRKPVQVTGDEYGKNMSALEAAPALLTGTLDDVNEALAQSAAYRERFKPQDNDASEDTLRHILVSGYMHNKPNKFARYFGDIASGLLDDRELGGSVEDQIDLNNNAYGRALREKYPDRDEFTKQAIRVVRELYRGNPKKLGNLIPMLSTGRE
jgi:hypothetical protein